MKHLLSFPHNHLKPNFFSFFFFFTCSQILLQQIAVAVSTFHASANCLCCKFLAFTFSGIVAVVAVDVHKSGWRWWWWWWSCQLISFCGFLLIGSLQPRAEKTTGEVIYLSVCLPFLFYVLGGKRLKKDTYPVSELEPSISLTLSDGLLMMTTAFSMSTLMHKELAS